MAHADGIGVGKSQAELNADSAMVLADGVPFAADVLFGVCTTGNKRSTT